jgi:hypothetical protein
MGFAAIGGLLLLVVLFVWFLVDEAKSGAVSKAALAGAKEVISATKRFNNARRDSRGLSRSERIEFMLREVRGTGGGGAVPGDDGGDADPPEDR